MHGEVYNLSLISFEARVQSDKAVMRAKMDCALLLCLMSSHFFEGFLSRPFPKNHRNRPFAAWQIAAIYFLKEQKPNVFFSSTVKVKK